MHKAILQKNYFNLSTFILLFHCKHFHSKFKMRFIKLNSFLFIFLLTASIVAAQTYEVGILVGGSVYEGDVSDDALNLRETKPSYGAFIKYNFQNQFTLKAGFNIGRLTGSDANSKDPGIQLRGFAFDNNLREVYIGGEWHFLDEKSSYKRIYNLFTQKFSPFVFIGVGFASTDGLPIAPADRIPYPFPEAGAKNSFITPSFGLGFNYRMNENYCFGIDLGWRPTFSDYIDGVSINGNPNRKDWYFIGGVSFSYILDYKNF